MPEPSPEAWAQIRYDYEHTSKTVDDICVEHGTTANTLRLRARKWGWRMRRARIPAEGPPPLTPRSETEITELGPRLRGDEGGKSEAGGDVEPSPHIDVPIAPAADDTAPIGQRLQGAVGRILPAIEMTLARLTAEPIRPREMETAARALGSLMRTLRELNGLQGQHPAKADNDPPPEDMDEFRNELARRLETVVADHEAQIPAKYEAAWNEFAAEVGSRVDVPGTEH